MGGGSDVSFPGPSQEERDLQRQQLELLQQSRAETDAFKPILMQEFGLVPKYTIEGTEEFKKSKELQKAIDENQTYLDRGYNASGYQYTDADNNYFKEYIPQLRRQLATVQSAVMKTEAQIAKEAKQAEIEGATNEVSLLQAKKLKMALEGNLPISEGTIQRKAQEFQKFKEQAARNGNPIFGDTPEEAFSTSTAGTQAIKAFNDNWKLVEDQERQGQVSQGFGNLATGVQTGGTQGAISRPGVPDLGTGKLLPFYSQAMQPYQFDRQGQFQAGATNATNAAQRQAGLMSMVGSLGGAATTGALLMASSEKFKKGIKATGDKGDKKALSVLRSAKTFNYKYKGEGKETGEHTGVVIERGAPKDIISKDGEHINIGDYVGLLHSSVRALSKEVEKLKGKKKEVANG